MGEGNDTRPEKIQRKQTEGIKRLFKLKSEKINELKM